MQTQQLAKSKSGPANSSCSTGCIREEDLFSYLASSGSHLGQKVGTELHRSKRKLVNNGIEFCPALPDELWIKFRNYAWIEQRAQQANSNTLHLHTLSG
jgi:hypothetical protein